MIRTSTPIATTTLAGISTRATDVAAIAGVSQLDTISPSNLTAKIDVDGTLAGNLDTMIASQKATKTYADTKLAKTSNLSDVNSAPAAFTNIKQTATTSASGVVTVATDAITVTGTSTTTVTTPANITARLATPGTIGNNSPATSIATNTLKLVTGAGAGKVPVSDASGNLTPTTPGTMFTVNLFVSTVAPSSGTGVDGDIYFMYV